MELRFLDNLIEGGSQLDKPFSEDGGIDYKVESYIKYINACCDFLESILEDGVKERDRIVFTLPKENIEKFVQYYNKSVLHVFHSERNLFDAYRIGFLAFYINEDSVKGELMDIPINRSTDYPSILNQYKQQLPAEIAEMFSKRNKRITPIAVNEFAGGLTTVLGKLDKLIELVETNFALDDQEADFGEARFALGHQTTNLGEVNDFGEKLVTSSILPQLIEKYKDIKRPSKIIPLVFALYRLNVLNIEVNLVKTRELFKILCGPFGAIGSEQQIGSQLRRYQSLAGIDIDPATRFLLESEIDMAKGIISPLLPKPKAE